MRGARTITASRVMPHGLILYLTNGKSRHLPTGGGFLFRKAPSVKRAAIPASALIQAPMRRRRRRAVSFNCIAQDNSDRGIEASEISGYFESLRAEVKHWP